MKTIVLAVLLAAAAAPALQDEFAAAEPLEQHAWLQQLVGEWTVTSQSSMGEDWTVETTETIRPLGKLWIVAESHATHDGVPFASIMTLGYDPEREAFVGTWVDTMQTHLWTYVGTLDDARKVLTLEARGPGEEPGVLRDYRDVIELVGPDRKTLTSHMRGDDGTWTEFLRVEYRRRARD